MAVNQVTLFPDVPRSRKMVDDVGNLVPEWYLYFQNLSLSLQSNFQNEGVRAPSQAATDITKIKDQSNIVGNIIYDKTNHVWKGIAYASGDPGDPTTVIRTFTVT